MSSNRNRIKLLAIIDQDSLYNLGIFVLSPTSRSRKPDASWHSHLVDGECQRMPVDKIDEPLRAWQDVKRAVDGQGHHRQLQLVGECEGTLPEKTHVTCERTGTLWEHRHTISFLQNLAGTLVGFESS